MKPGAPWSVKGIEPAVRETAKEKAKAAGMTLGQWLNSTISGAGETAAPTASVAPAGGGSALDTARVMRAIAELARRVDVLSNTEQASGGNPALMTRLDALDARLGSIAQALPSEQPEMDQARLERGMITIARRIEVLEKGLNANPDGLAEMHNEIARLEQQLNGLPDRIQAMQAAAAPAATDAPDFTPVMDRLAQLDQRLDTMETALNDAPAPVPATAQADETQVAALNENIRKLMNGMINLGAKVDQVEQKVARRLEPLEERISGLKSDTENSRNEDRASFSTALKRMEQRIAESEPADRSADIQTAVQSAVQSAIAPLVHQVARQKAASAEDNLHQNETKDVPDSHSDATEDSADTSETVVGTLSDSQFDTTTVPDIDVPLTTEPMETGQPVAEPEPEPERRHPQEDDDTFRPVAALNDLTGTEALHSPPMDDQEFFKEIDLPQTSEEAGIGPDHDTPSARLSAAPEPNEPATDENTKPDQSIDEPERPVGLLPVEQLLADNPPAAPDAGATDFQASHEPTREPEQEPAHDATSENRRGAAVAAGGGTFRLDEPLDLSRQPPPEPTRAYPGRRSWLRYIIFALIFLIVLIAGFWFVGTQQFRDLSQQVSSLWDDAMVGVRGLDESTPEQGTTEPRKTDDTQGSTTTGPTSEVETKPLTAPTAESDTAPTTLATTTPAEPEATTPAASEPAQPSETGQPAEPPSQLDQLIAKANAGDADAQFEMGVRARDGIGVEPDYSQAADWFDKAAQQGHVQAQLGLGVMYRQGLGRAQDLDLAKLWLHAAARAGNADAQKYLGEVYVDDRSGVPDYFQAARWFREAAEQGLVDAQYNMGVLYEGGLGVPRDFEQSYYWFDLARQAGDNSAAEDLRRVGALLTPEQRAEIENRSSGFTPAKAPPVSALPSANTTSEGADTILSRRDQVRQVQEQLIARGYDPGVPDGIPGAKTREAIAQWQRDSGRNVVGQITESVLNALLSNG